MEDLKFKYIAARNFMCFGTEGIEVDLTSLGNIVLLTGENKDRKNDLDDEKISCRNGIGKSSFISIVVYTLFGKTINGITNQELLINHKIKKNLRTEVRVGNYKIVRTRKKNTLRVWENKEGVFPKDDDDKKFNEIHEISKGGIPATQEFLEKCIGWSYETFVNTVIFTDNNINSFLECDPETKREIVENLLNIGHYRLYGDKAKEIKNSHKNKIASMAQNYERFVMEVDAVDKRIAKIKKESEDWINNKKKEIYLIEKEINSKKESLLNKDSGALLVTYIAAQEEIKTLNESIAPMMSSLDKIKDILASIETQKESNRKIKNSVELECQEFSVSISRLNSDIKSLQQSINSFESKKGVICSSCMGVVSEDNYINFVNKSKKEIGDKLLEIEEKTKLQSLKQEELLNLQKKSSTLESASQSGKQKSNEIFVKITNANNRVLELSRINKPQITVDEKIIQEKIENLKQLMSSKQKEMEISPYSSILKDAVEEYDIKQKECNEKRNELKIAEEELPYYDFWTKAFGDTGIRKFVIDGIIPALNYRIAHWMQFLIDGKIKLLFDNELNDIIENNPSDGDPFVYNALSGGERRRVNLAVSQGFAYIGMVNSGISPNIVFLDEVTTNIDPQGVEGVYNMINELAKTKQVFITTHDNYLLELLSGCEMIKLVKENDFTTIK